MNIVDIVFLIVYWYLIGLTGTILMFRSKTNIRKELDSVLMLAIFGPIVWVAVFCEWHNYFGRD